MTSEFAFPNGHESRFPMISVRLGHQGKWIIPVRGLVDSGAICTLAQADIATVLGIADISKPPKGHSVHLSGIGGGRHKAYEWEVDMELTNTVGVPQSQQRTISLSRVKVFFTQATLARPILLGQYDLLEKLFFYQMNNSPEPQFVLHDEAAKVKRRLPS